MVKEEALVKMEVIELENFKILSVLATENSFLMIFIMRERLNAILYKVMEYACGKIVHFMKDNGKIISGMALEF
jgi:hypothetical protein